MFVFQDDCLKITSLDVENIVGDSPKTITFQFTKCCKA